MAEPDAGVVAAPPVAPGAGSAPAPEPSTGSEPVTNSDGHPMPDNQIPFERFQKVTDQVKEQTERGDKLQQEIEDLRAAQTPSSDEEIDPDVQKILDSYVKKNGFVTKAELDKVEQEANTRIQVQNDVAELKTQYKDYDHSKVLSYAQENNIPITSKKALDAVYTIMNKDSILDNARKVAVAEFQESGRSGGEKPGSQGAQPPGEAKPTNIRDRVRMANQRK